MKKPGATVLEKKLRKIVNCRTDTKEMLDAINALSTVYKANTLENRRSLRADLELRGLSIAKEFLDSFQVVEQSMLAAEASIREIDEGCSEMLSRVERIEASTLEFSRRSGELNTDLERAQQRADSIESFLERFQLSPEQVRALRSDPVDMEGGNVFFDALAAVHRIRKESQDLLSSQYQGAGLEVFESMAEFQERAHERLFRFVQENTARLDGESTEAPAILRRALLALRVVPAYHRHCRDTIVVARRDAVGRRFLLALIHGGVHGTPRPIEMHAHDPLRYVGDMLAWVHQAVAHEKEFAADLFDGNDNAADELGFLRCVFSGLAEPVASRVHQILGNVSSPVVAYKLSNLLGFYFRTISGLLPNQTDTGAEIDQESGDVQGETDASVCAEFVAILEALRDATKSQFYRLLDETTTKLLESPPSYPSDLSVAHALDEVIRQLGEILAVHDASLLNDSDATESNDIDAMVGAFVDPLLKLCRLSASGLDRSDTAVYIINNLVALQITMAPYAFTAARVQCIVSEIDTWMSVLVQEQSSATLTKCGMQPMIETLQAGVAETDRALTLGLQPSMVAAAFRAFSSDLSLIMPDFDRLARPRLRVQARNDTAEALANAYSELHAFAVARPDTHGKPDFSPEQVKTLLGL